MSRAVAEWIGKNDERIPPRVKDRIFKKFAGRCAHCTLKIEGKLRPEFDHTIALCNDGENRETNVSLLCMLCHKVKSAADVAEKSTVARKRKKHLGIAAPRQKIASRGFAKAAPQRSASRPIERRS